MQLSDIVLYVLIILFFIILYNLTDNTILNKKRDAIIISTPIKLDSQKIHSVRGSELIPPLKNGISFCISFWIFIERIMNEDEYRLVFARSNTQSILSASPIFYIDKNSNRLIVKVKTLLGENTQLTGDHPDSLIVNTTNAKTLHMDNCFYNTLTIDFIPLQKWSHILLNVDNTTAALSLNGELISTRNINRECPDLARVYSGMSGDIILGSTDKMPAVNGYISNLRVFNHALDNVTDIRDVYNAGPLANTLMSKLGLETVGIRSPIFNITELK